MASNGTALACVLSGIALIWVLVCWYVDAQPPKVCICGDDEKAHVELVKYVGPRTVRTSRGHCKVCRCRLFIAK